MSSVWVTSVINEYTPDTIFFIEIGEDSDYDSDYEYDTDSEYEGEIPECCEEGRTNCQCEGPDCLIYPP